MHYKMPTYHVGDQWVAMASQKFYISLYTCERENIQNFRNAYPAIRTGQGCINFRDKDELPKLPSKKYCRGRCKQEAGSKIETIDTFYRSGQNCCNPQTLSEPVKQSED